MPGTSAKEVAPSVTLELNHRRPSSDTRTAQVPRTRSRPARAASHLCGTPNQATLADQVMHLRDQPNSHLIWLSISPNISILLYSQAVAMFLSYIASIVFFFYNRRDSVNNLEHLAQGGI